MANELELFEKLVGFFHGAGWASDWTAESFMAWMHSHGLHLVTDADMRVLDGCAKLGLDEVRYLARAHEHEWAVAELARRGEKP